MGVDLSKPIDQKLDTDLATGLASSGSDYVPTTTYYTPEGEGWSHHFKPEVGGLVDQIGSAGTMTWTGSPTYNPNGSSPSGEPSYTLTGAMRATSTDGDLLDLFDGTSACAVAPIWRYTGSASGTDSVWSAGITSANTRMHFYRHPGSSFPTYLRNDGSGSTLGTLSQVFVPNDDYYAINIYDGSETSMLIRELNKNSTGIEQPLVTTNTRNIGTVNAFMVNASTRLGGSDMGTTEWYGILVRGDVPTTEQIENTQWWLMEQIGYTTARVSFGGANAYNLAFWNDCPQERYGSISIAGSAWENYLPGTPGFNGLLDAIVVRPPGDTDIIFVHGEEDAQDEDAANAYEDRWLEVIDEVASRLSGYTFRWFCEYINSSNTSTYASTVRTAQENVVAARSNVFAHSNSDALPLTLNTYDSGDRATRQGFMDTLISAS